MGPKVDAVCRFVAILAGHAGTVVTPSGTYDGEHAVPTSPMPC
jgi:hypothetical protein